MGKPQILVRFKQGDHAYFDIDGREELEELKKQLNTSSDEWIYVSSFAVVKKEELDRIFYFPEGYPNAQSSQNSLSQS